MAYKILISDNLHSRGIDLLASREGAEVDVKTDLSPGDLLEIIGSYEGLVIRSATKVTGEVIARANNLKVIGRAGTGLDNVDIPAATRRGVVLMNTPGGNSEAAAEHTLALIMAAHRHIPQAVESMKAGKWEKKKFQGREIAGKTLGIIGLGKIGGIVAGLASRGMGMTTLGYDPIASPEAISRIGVKAAELDEIFSKSDVITVHTPLNRDTLNLINAAAFEKMRDGVIVINCARAGIVNEDDLLQALESGKVAVAAIDVFSKEPPGPTSLVQHLRVIATPHLAASTQEAQLNVAVAVAEQMIDYLENGIVRNAVNVPAVEPAVREKIAPYLDLARRIAQFGVLLVDGGVSEIEVAYRGRITEGWDLTPVTNAALVGLFQRSEGGNVNYVNAPVIAKERQVHVSETTQKQNSDSRSSVAVRILLTDGSGVRVEGALIWRSGHEPRIIALDNYVTEAAPSGPMLVVTNRDIPGMIAKMTTALADGGVNIAQMNLSRDGPGGTALAIINTDTPVKDATLEQIRKIAGILRANRVVVDD